jgi:hypothetical protein
MQNYIYTSTFDGILGDWEPQKGNNCYGAVNRSKGVLHVVGGRMLFPFFGFVRRPRIDLIMQTRVLENNNFRSLSKAPRSLLTVIVQDWKSRDPCGHPARIPSSKIMIKLVVKHCGFYGLAVAFLK